MNEQYEAIPESIIDGIPLVVETTRASCQACYDAIKALTAALGYERPGMELMDSWSFTHLDPDDALAHMNGTNNYRSFLSFIRRTALAYNGLIPIQSQENAKREILAIRGEADEWFRTAWERLNAIVLPIPDKQQGRPLRH